VQCVLNKCRSADELWRCLEWWSFGAMKRWWQEIIIPLVVEGELWADDVEYAGAVASRDILMPPISHILFYTPPKAQKARWFEQLIGCFGTKRTHRAAERWMMLWERFASWVILLFPKNYPIPMSPETKAETLRRFFRKELFTIHMTLNQREPGGVAQSSVIDHFTWLRGTLPFKSLGSLRNVFIFQRKALFFQ